MKQIYQESGRVFEQTKKKYLDFIARGGQENPSNPISGEEARILAGEISNAGRQVYVVEHRLNLNAMLRAANANANSLGVGYNDLPGSIEQIREDREFIWLSELETA